MDNKGEFKAKIQPNAFSKKHQIYKYKEIHSLVLRVYLLPGIFPVTFQVLFLSS